MPHTEERTSAQLTDSRDTPPLAPPSLPDALPLLPDETAYMIPVAKRLGPLNVTVPELWAGFEETQFLHFYWGNNSTPIHTVPIIDPDPGQFPMTFKVPGIDLRMGSIYKLYYQVESPGGVGDSEAINVNLDNLAPNLNQRPAALQFPPEVITDGVTSAYLASHNDQVIASIDTWADIKLEDQVVYYLDRAPTPQQRPLSQVGILTIKNEHLGQPKIDVPYLGDAFRDLGNGHWHAVYYLRDRAGNEGPNSPHSAPFDVALDPPVTLPMPQVPLFDQYGLINEAVARTPLQVVVPAFAGAFANDSVVIHWGNAPGQTRVISDPAADPLLQVDIPYSLVQAAGNGALDVSYELWRNGASLGSSAAKSVLVDISLPGGPDPDPDNPEHGNLQRPTALGASGVPNVISIADLDQPAKVIIDWNGIDGTVVFKQADHLSAHWGDIVLTYDVTAADVIAGRPLALTISPEQMAQAGAGSLDLRYSITRQLPAPPGHSNTAYSRTQLITVADKTGIPGGGDPMISGDFPQKNAHNAINKAAAEFGTPFRVFLDYENAAVNDLLEFKFRGHRGFGPDPELEPANPIPGSYTEGSHRITQKDLDHGSVDFIVARAHLVAINFASANGYYWVTNSAGTAPGEPYHVLVDTGDLEP